MKIFNKKLLISLLVLPLFLASSSVAGAAEVGFMATMMWGVVTSLFGTLLGWSGLLLNASVEYFVIGFGDSFLNSGLGSAVNSLWENVRDLFNLTFIFGLVYIGFKMILDSDNSGTRRWLVNLIMAALLVNFSLYITKFIVDFTNLLASQIAFGFANAGGEIQISNTFMNLLGLTDLLGSKGVEVVNKGGEPWAYIFGTAMLFIVATFVFAAGAILLLIRYAVLSIYMILSPMMFIGWVFPGLSSYSQKYWKGFLGKAFFAPMYLLLIYFAATVLKAFYFAMPAGSGVNQYAAALNGGGNQGIDANFINTIPPFILTCVFLIAAVVIANKMGAEGAGAAVNIMNKTKNKAQQLTKRGLQRGGGMAWGGSKAVVATTGGRVARAGSYHLGRSLDKGIRKLQTSTSSNVAVRAARGISNLNSVDATMRSGTGKLRNTKFGMSHTKEEDTKIANDIKNRNERASDTKKNKEIYENSESTATEKRDAKNAIGAEVRKMTNDDIDLYSNKDLKSEAISGSLTEAHMKHLRESGRLDNEKMDDLAKARDDSNFAESFTILDQSAEDFGDNMQEVTENITGAFDQLGKNVRTMSNERLENLGLEKLKNARIAMHMKDEQFDHLEKSGKHSTADIDKMKAARKKGLMAVAEGNYSDLDVNLSDEQRGSAEFKTFVVDRQANLMSGSTKEQGQLVPEVFMVPAMAPHIKTAGYEERLRNGRVSNAQKVSIQDNVKNYVNAPEDPAASEQARREKKASQKATKKMWKKWSNSNSTYAGQSDFDSFEDPPTPEVTSATPEAGVIEDANGNIVSANNQTQTPGAGNNRSQYNH